MIDQILDSIDHHVRTYNLWSEDMKVVMSAWTLSDLRAEMSYSDPLTWAYQFANHVDTIGGVMVVLLPGIPRGEWVISTDQPLTAWFDYTSTVT